MASPRTERPYNAAIDAQKIPSLLVVSGTVGTADTSGTAETIRVGGNPTTGAMYVQNVGGGASDPASGTLNTIGTVGSIQSVGQIHNAGTLAAGDNNIGNVDVVTGTITTGSLSNIAMVHAGTHVHPTGTVTTIVAGTQNTLGTVGVLNNGTLAQVTSISNIASGTLLNSGTTTGVGIVTRTGNLGTLELGSVVVTSLPSSGTLLNLATGTLAAVTTVTTVSNLTNGTVRVSVGTITTGTLQNLVSGTINALAAGTITAGTLQVSAGTIAGSSVVLTGSVTSGTTDIIAATDVTGYRAFSIQMSTTPVFSGSVTVEASNDNSTYQQLRLQDTSETNGEVIVITPGVRDSIFYGPINFRYLRVRMNAYASGTAQAFLYLNTFPTDHKLLTLSSVSDVGNISDGFISTVSSVSNLVKGTVQLNPVPVPTMLTFGTLGTAGGSFMGTISAASGAGTRHFVSGVSVVMQSGTADVRVMAGTLIQGTGVIVGGQLVPGGVNETVLTPAFATGTNSELVYHFVGAGTAFITLRYWKGT